MHRGYEVDLATIPQEDAVYDMLCEADSIGVFQVESRAQMATLPRLKPRTFYDLVVEVALIRPGPIQGGSVHPYIRRRNGTEPVTYLHPLLEGSLSKTLGVPLFQEQLMQMAIDVAGFTPSEADQLRQAMGSKRSRERMERLRERLYEGMAERGITGEIADRIFEKMAAFANFGFPESHSVSFAYLVYASSWIKLHEPAAFCAALLNAQPMGFYSPHSLVQDACRHGVDRAHARRQRERCAGDAGAVRGVAPRRGGAARHRVGASRRRRPRRGHRRRTPVREHGGLHAAYRRHAAGARSARDGRRVRLLRGRRRPRARRAGRRCGRRGRWPSRAPTGWRAWSLGVDAPTLPGMSLAEEANADLWATGVSPDGHPTRFVRPHLDELGVVTAVGLVDVDHGSRVLVGGVVTHRQRPATASGTTFINLEDETGLINVICSKGCWARYRRVARGAPALLIRGRVEKAEGVINVVAEKLEAMPVGGSLRSRDFR